MANLRIAPQRSRSAARHVGQHKVEYALFCQRSRIGQPALDAVAKRRKPLAQMRRGAARSTRTQRCALPGCAPRESASCRPAPRSNRESRFPRPAISATSCEPSSCSLHTALRETPPWRSHRRRHITRARSGVSPVQASIPASAVRLQPPGSRCATSAQAAPGRDGRFARRLEPIERAHRSTIHAGCACANASSAALLSEVACPDAAASLRSTAFTMPDANSCPACLASSTLSSIAARAGMRSRCSS